MICHSPSLLTPFQWGKAPPNRTAAATSRRRPGPPPPRTFAAWIRRRPKPPLSRPAAAPTAAPEPPPTRTAEKELSPSSGHRTKSEP